MKRTANPAVHCTRLVSKRWDHSCVSRKPAPVVAIATTSTPPQIRMSFRFRSASDPALFTKMCGPTSAKVPKQIQNKKGYKPVGIFIMANAANDPAQAGRASDVRLSTKTCSRPCLQPDGSALFLVVSQFICPATTIQSNQLVATNADNLVALHLHRGICICECPDHKSAFDVPRSFSRHRAAAPDHEAAVCLVFHRAQGIRIGYPSAYQLLAYFRVG